MNESIGRLVKEYREAALAHGKATIEGDYKSANLNHDKLVALLLKIRESGGLGQAALLALAEDQDQAVACWAATHSLKFDEERALAILNKLSEKLGPMGFNAKMVIQQWKKGQLILP